MNVKSKQSFFSFTRLMKHKGKYQMDHPAQLFLIWIFLSDKIMQGNNFMIPKAISSSNSTEILWIALRWKQTTDNFSALAGKYSQ